MEASVSAGMMFQRVPSQCSISAWYPCSVGTLLPTDQTSVAEIAATAVSALSAVPVLGLGITWPGQSAEASWGCWIIATKIQNQQRSMRYVFALVIPCTLSWKFGSHHHLSIHSRLSVCIGTKILAQRAAGSIR